MFASFSQSIGLIISLGSFIVPNGAQIPKWSKNKFYNGDSDLESDTLSGSEWSHGELSLSDQAPLVMLKPHEKRTLRVKPLVRIILIIF